MSGEGIDGRVRMRTISRGFGKSSELVSILNDSDTADNEQTKRRDLR